MRLKPMDFLIIVLLALAVVIAYHFVQKKFPSLKLPKKDVMHKNEAVENYKRQLAQRMWQKQVASQKNKCGGSLNKTDNVIQLYKGAEISVGRGNI
jgi:hypothetical protein